MRWKTPQPGDKRERVIFAFWPIECVDGQTRWLCRVRVEEEYNAWGYELPSWNWEITKAFPLEEKQ